MPSGVLTCRINAIVNTDAGEDLLHRLARQIRAHVNLRQRRHRKRAANLQGIRRQPGQMLRHKVGRDVRAALQARLRVHNAQRHSRVVAVTDPVIAEETAAIAHVWQKDRLDQ